MQKYSESTKGMGIVTCILSIKRTHGCHYAYSLYSRILQVLFAVGIEEKIWSGNSFDFLLINLSLRGLQSLTWPSVFFFFCFFNQLPASSCLETELEHTLSPCHRPFVCVEPCVCVEL